jgi:FkbM family methyltransferase
MVPGPVRGLIRRMPGVAAAQRAAINVLGRNEEFEHTIDYGPAKGLKLPIRLPEDKGFWKGTYEEDFCRRLASAVQPGDVCFDIGAFRGYTAGVMALAGASGVAAFEPAPTNQEVIARVIAMNPQLPVELVRAAVGEKSGQIRITIHEDASMNFIGENNSGRPSLQVDLVTVDNLVNEGRNPAPHLLKIDVEGAEAGVLRGAAEALRDSVREIFVELHHGEAKEECCALLADAGFDRVWQAEEEGVFPMQTHFRKRE